MSKQLKKSEIEIEKYVEIIDNRLFFAVIKSYTHRRLKSPDNTMYFSIDDEFQYQNYFSDFGPLNISCLFKYCVKLNKFLKYAEYNNKSIIHYTCSNPDKKANAVFLIGCYCVIYLGSNPKDISKLLQVAGPFKPFLDASQYYCSFTLKLIDCFQAILKATIFNFVNFNDFNAAEYDLYNKLEYGDMNWLIPRKFLAFIGPAENKTSHSPEFYIRYFLKNDVKTVIRLNHVLYDSSVFLQVGIQHYDLIFPDGTTPPKDILLKFLYIVETAPAAIAVHCKAGLGRTGSLIGAYLIKHYRMRAREAIAWLRMCRPGSVIGQQQLWLEKIESWLWRIGSQYRLQRYGEGDKIPRHKYGIYSKLWPLEREKIIRDTKKKIQANFTTAQLTNVIQSPPPVGSNRLWQNEEIVYPNRTKSIKSISKLLSSIHGFMKEEKEEKGRSIIENVVLSKPKKMLRKAQKVKQKKGQESGKGKTSQGDKLNEIKAIRHKRLFEFCANS